MADDLSRLIDEAKKIGFEYAGQDGRNHIVLVNGDLRYTTSFTTSDWRAHQNALRDMERMSGRKLPRQKTGKYRFKPSTPSSMRLSAEEIRDGAEVDNLLANAESMRQRFRELAKSANRREVQVARQLLEDFERVKEALADHHRVVDPIY